MVPRLRFAAYCMAAYCGLGAASALSEDRHEELDTMPAARALPALVQQLMNALPGNAAVWQRYLSESAVYVSEAGEVTAKMELLKEFAPFPPDITGSIEVRNPRVTELGTVAIVVFDAHEKQTVFDQHIEVDYRGTQTWRRERGRWRLLAAEAVVLARDPPALPIDLARLRDFAGTYELSGDRRYRVELRGEILLGGREGGELVPLIAVGDNVFADAGSNLGILRIFVRRRDGTVDRMVQRRKFADLIWARVAANRDDSKP